MPFAQKPFRGRLPPEILKESQVSKFNIARTSIDFLEGHLIKP
jgi:hypothetical protein